jgi:two-component system CheB/CheR fusion protein
MPGREVDAESRAAHDGAAPARGGAANELLQFGGRIGQIGDAGARSGTETADSGVGVTEPTSRGRKRSGVAQQKVAGPADAAAPAAADAVAQEVPKAFPIVGIGGSAGGLAAFEAFFSALPTDIDLDIAFVLVQHLLHDHRSMLAPLIGRHTRMPVCEAVDGMLIEPGRVYIIPPAHDLSIEDGRLRLQSHEGRPGPHMTVDHFFRSLAQARGDHAICIVMSGSGSDGALGAREVKGEGGLVIAQSPETSEYDSMPRSVIASGVVDYVLSPSEIATQLLTFVRHAYGKRPARPPTPRGTVLKRICALLRAHTGHDFSQYKETTLVRRLDRRMALHQVQDVDEYLEYARDNSQEIDALFRDLLIGVTSFFRDADAFRILEEQVIPQLLNRPDRPDPVRVWVCGCSTGEEAYSIAMLLFEQAQALPHPCRIQIFATDIDPHAIEHARAGVYPVNIASDVSEQRLARFFVYDAEASCYRIQKHIRDMLIFSEQDVIRDPPFSRLDLLTCRNLLIYLNGDIQKRLIALFHYALLPHGVLFLGASETIGDGARRFSVLDRKAKFYQRFPDETGLRSALPEFPTAPDATGTRVPVRTDAADVRRTSLREVTEHALLEHYAPAGVLIDPRGNILHIMGRTGQFLEPTAGDAAMNIVDMARQGLSRELSMALHKAVTLRQPVRYTGLRVLQSNGHEIVANLAVRPVSAPVGEASHFLVVLEEVPAVEGGAAAAAGSDDARSRQVADLERELRSKEEYLQTTLEEMQSTNEELRSTNEEMQSVNEELQSTNEELETSKEELQSVNEELSTVNAELQDRVADLSRANSDMNNLLAATGIGTLFVDRELRIARFTPAATQVINLIASDVGRPLEHVSTNVVGYDGLADDIRGVRDSLLPREAEFRTKAGNWYLMRIRPYRTMENQVEGMVVTLVDISQRRAAEEALRQSEARLAAFLQQAYAGVCEVDLQGRLTFVNDRLCDMLGYTLDELLQRRMRDISDPSEFAEEEARMRAIAMGGAASQNERAYVRKNGDRLRILERMSAIRDAQGRPASLLALSFDLA